MVVFQDTLWAACFGEGLFYKDGHQWQSYREASRYLTDLATGAGSLWYATWMEGVIGRIADKKTPPKTIPLPRFVTPRFAYRTECIAVHGKRVWVGSHSHLMVLTLQGWEPGIHPDFLYEEWEMALMGGASAIVPTKDGAWVVAEGLWRLTIGEKGSLSFKPVPLPSALPQNSPLAIALAGTILWVGTGATIWKYEFSSGQWHQEARLPQSENVKVLLPYRGRVYVGSTPGKKAKSAGEGHVGLLERSHWRWFREVQVGAVADLAVFEGSLWIAGSEGVQSLSLE